MPESKDSYQAHVSDGSWNGIADSEILAKSVECKTSCLLIPTSHRPKRFTICRGPSTRAFALFRMTDVGYLFAFATSTFARNRLRRQRCRAGMTSTLRSGE